MVSSTADYLEVSTSPEMLQYARDNFKASLAKYGDGNHRKNKPGAGLTGFIAEEAIKHALPFLPPAPIDDYDFILPNPFKTIDSKSTGCNSIPLTHYTASAYTHQKLACDLLIFSRVKNDNSIVWICGYISKKRFMAEAKLCKSGTENNNFKYEQPRLTIPYNRLKEIAKLMKYGG
jgi:hypothetical protein